MSRARPALVAAARKLLDSEWASAADDPDPPLDAVSRAWEKLALHLGKVVGADGVVALFGRSVTLVGRDHPWLGHAGGDPRTPWVRLRTCLETQEPAARTEAAIAVIATFAELLATFIGEDLVMRILREAWPDVFLAPEPASKETR